jgi:hypothetical protein
MKTQSPNYYVKEKNDLPSKQEWEAAGFTVPNELCSERDDNPTCGACQKVMTPQNSTIIPEMFLCDECAKSHGYYPRTPVQLVPQCAHDGTRHAQTSIADQTVLRMEWCGECGKLMDRRTWKIPLAE